MLALIELSLAIIPAPEQGASRRTRSTRGKTDGSCRPSNEHTMQFDTPMLQHNISNNSSSKCKLSS